MTRNPPNRIPGLGFTAKSEAERTKAYHLSMVDMHSKDMLRPAVRVSYCESDHLCPRID